LPWNSRRNAIACQRGSVGRIVVISVGDQIRGIEDSLLDGGHLEHPQFHARCAHFIAMNCGCKRLFDAGTFCV
jgi:hypothetical protein